MKTLSKSNKSFFLEDRKTIKKISSDYHNKFDNHFQLEKFTSGNYVGYRKNNIIIGTENIMDILRISKSDGIAIKNLRVTNIADMENIKTRGDIMANNIELIGDIITSKIHATDTITTDGNIISTNLKSHGIIEAKNLSVIDKIISDNIICNQINTGHIFSNSNLYLETGSNNIVSIPNVRYQTKLIDVPIITPEDIKKSKIFIVTKNIILYADEFCDGIEIIVYNDNPAFDIAIRNVTTIIDTIPIKCATKLVYIHAINKWIKM